MEKNDVRNIARNVLKNITNENKLKLSESIRNSLYNVFGFLNADSVFVYVSTENEPSTREIIVDCLIRGIRVFIPKIVDGVMLATEVSPNAEYAENKFGIIEATNIEPVENFECTFNVVPMLAFDKNRNRLGHGGGYYDKFLKNASGMNVGLAFDCQCVDEVPTNDLDVKLDVIITERNLYK
ncbi:MAG: 5-formyltetrahydrofolate cyclo-ligase [Clostridia bacterium]